MISDWDKYQKAYIQASEETKFIIDSNIISIGVSDLIEKNKILPELKKDLILVYTDMLVGLISESEMSEYLSQEKKLNQNQITEIISFLKNFLEGENTNLYQPTVEVDTLANTNNPISYIRTMAQDMNNSNNDELIYSSTQAAILNEAKSKDTSADRWGNETK